MEESKNLTFEPTLPRYRKRPWRLDDGEPIHMFDCPQAFHRQQYLEAFDLVCGALKERFHQ